ncbi:hypothetical protein AGMMS50284_0780 [Clostridia bacterium]|nr:hypothetical protein AGMMS50284_0780 [Clostridia bacterium]
MSSYKIADLVVEMQPQFEKMAALLPAYEIEPQPTSDISIKLENEFFLERQKEHPHLRLSDIENIFTLSSFSNQLINFDGMVIHASAIEYDGEAYLFSGDSGVGKSTHTALWQERFGTEKVTIINDDKPVIRLVNNEFFVYGSPWCGASYSNKNIKTPLKAIVFLEQDLQNWIKPIKNTSELVYKILSHTKRTFSKNQTVKLMKLMDKLIECCKFYSMGCDVSADAVETAVRQLISNI